MVLKVVSIMKTLTLTFVLLASLAIVILAEPVPDQANVSRHRGIQYLKDDVKDTDQFDQNENPIDLTGKDSASSGRLFRRKFSFSNIFGQKQPIIPIIITGVNTDPDLNADTNTDTDTDTNTNIDPPTIIDTITGETPTGTITNGAGDTTTNTDTNNPLTPTADTAANPTNPNARIQLYSRGAIDQNDNKNHEDVAEDVDEQTLAAAHSVDADKYVVTDEEIKGISSAKSNRSPARIILRRRGSRRGQVIRVRIPAKYRGDLQNGQFVIINANRRKRPLKRRVIRRHKNRRRKNKNRNRRRRITAP